MSTTVWKKITRKATPKERADGKPEDILLAEPWLEIREGKYRTAYRVRFRQDGVKLEQNLEGEFATWREAEKAGDRLIYDARFGKRPKDPKAERAEDTFDAVVALKKPPLQSLATYEQIESIGRVHIKPYLRGECAYETPAEPCPYRAYIEACPFTSQLTPSVWLGYKAHFRLHRPMGALFNHWKFWGMLFKYAFERGLLERPVQLAFDEKKEDHRKAGQLISNFQLRAFLRVANTTWRRRAIAGRLSGQRPGLIRKLRKDQVDLATGLVKVEKADSKNRRKYEFSFDEPVLTELRLQAERCPDSPYFFPNERRHELHMDKHLTGWNSAWTAARAWLLEESAKASVAGDSARAQRCGAEAADIPVGENTYTPHDLRHTCLTELALTAGINAFVEAHTHDISLEEWNRTYAHLDASKVKDLAPDGRPRVQQIFEEANGSG